MLDILTIGAVGMVGGRRAGERGHPKVPHGALCASAALGGEVLGGIVGYIVSGDFAIILLMALIGLAIGATVGLRYVGRLPYINGRSPTESLYETRRHFGPG